MKAVQQGYFLPRNYDNAGDGLFLAESGMQCTSVRQRIESGYRNAREPEHWHCFFFAILG